MFSTYAVSRNVSKKSARLLPVAYAMNATQAAEALLAETPPLMQEAFVEAFNNLQAWEKSMILASLQRLVALMDAGRFEGAPILSTCAMEPAHETLEPAMDDLSAVDLTPKL